MPTRVIHVIYVPGLADKLNRAIGQRTALALWRSPRLKPHYFTVDWLNGRETYQRKLTRLLNLIDTYSNKGSVALVAASAGSSLALTAFAKRTDKINAVVSICGKLHKPQSVAKELFSLNPAFKESMLAYERIESHISASERRKILVVQAAHDSYVPAADGRIAHAQLYHMPSIGHVFSIFMALTFFRHSIIRFIKQQNRMSVQK